MINSINATLENLNDRQREAVQITEGPLLVVAGAGSGKTRMLTVRIAYLIECCNVDPSEILAVTFTNKAAKEMKERVAGLVSGASAVTLTTFHAFCCMLLRRWSKYAGFEKGFTIYDESDSDKLMKNCLKELKYDTKTFPPKYCLEAISRAKNELIGPENYLESCSHGVGPTDIAVQKAYEAYQSALFKNQAVDFDDLIFKAFYMLNNNPELLERLQKDYKYFLVDEYQDTNQAQYRLIRLLSSKTRNLCVVGDEDQSIYSWRGATIRNIQEFANDFPGAKVVKLEQNYRSTQVILDAASDVISHNNSVHPKRLWTDKKGGELIKYYRATDDREESNWIVSQIKKLINEGRNPGDIALLYRMNSLTRTTEQALQRERIPYEITGGTKFFDRREVKDILAYLRVIDNTADSISLERIINTPKRGIGAAAIDKLYEKGDKNLWDGVSKEAAEKPNSKTGSFYKQIIKFMEAASELKVHELCKYIIDEIDYFQYLQKDDPETSEDRKNNVESLVSDIRYQEMDNPDLKLHDYLSTVALHADADDVDEKSQKVHLMTFHNAKGLEFPVVFMVAMEEKIFPHSRSENTPEELEEERRLAYVGITRAKELLYLTAASKRMMFGQFNSNLTSRFISEIPKDLREDIQTGYASGGMSSRYGNEGFTKTYQVPSRNSFGTRPKSSSGSPFTFSAQTKWVSSPKSNETIKDDTEPGTMVNIKEGVSVIHNVFGHGKVMAVSGSSLDDFKMTINFERVGTKTLLLQYASVRVIK
ncbi:MAG: UvrD-helicase domain-containing protein [Candidatus Riflebacteria bacterium]|nr:UvrD-helicase domain-containing protein [Candidatus Riflebacteria bacterium]